MYPLCFGLFPAAEQGIQRTEDPTMSVTIHDVSPSTIRYGTLKKATVEVTPPANSGVG